LLAVAARRRRGALLTRIPTPSLFPRLARQSWFLSASFRGLPRTNQSSSRTEPFDAAALTVANPQI
jgi:hypothetical protein